MCMCGFQMCMCGLQMCMCGFQMCIPRVPDLNGASLLYIMHEIHHSGWEPSICGFQM